MERVASAAVVPPKVMRFALLACVLIALEVVTRLGVVSLITLSPPTEMIAEAVSLVATGSLFPNLVRTSQETVVAFLLAMLAGIPLGLLLWRSAYLARVLEPYLAALYALPLVFFYPLLLAIYGIGPWPVITVAGTMSAVPIVLNTRVGMSEVPEIYRKLGRSLRAGGLRTFWQILLPAAAPYVFIGLKTGFIYAFIGSMAMEFILTDVGLGFMVNYHYNLFNTSTMYAYILIGVGLAAAINWTLGSLELRIRDWSVA